MSGFIGIISKDAPNSEAAFLDNCVVTIASCCDDYLGAWKSDRADLRFGWLQSCEDTSPVQLPYSPDQNLWIVGDVRLDNRSGFLKKLSPHYTAINDNTPDACLVLFAYMHWGEACLQHMAGDYAFAIWNEETATLFCARDHFGLIPFYYVQWQNQLLFTNFYLALKDIPNLTINPDDEVLRDYLVYGLNRSFDQTIYGNIKKLPPAHTLVFKNQEVQIRQYWDIPKAIEPVRYRENTAYASHFYRLIEQSVKDRTRTNKVASSLSGGMDSSSVTGITKKILRDCYGEDHQLIAYNIGYRELVSENEGYFAKYTASHLDIPIRQYFAEDYFQNFLQPVSSWIPEPVAIPNATAESHILNDATGFCRVYLTGFGGDPLFEYEKQSRQQLINRGHRLQAYMDDFRHYRMFGNISRTLSKILPKRDKKPTGQLPKASRPDWYNSTYFSEHKPQMSTNSDGTSIRSTFSMFRNPYWSWLFETSHPGFTGKKIMVRHPFFSLDIFNFIVALPPHLLYRKALLRMAMTPYLPDEVVKRPKTPLYGSPHTQYLKSQVIQGLLKIKGEESERFLSGKVNIQLLLEGINNPETTVASLKSLLNVLHTLTWRNNHPTENL